MVRLVLFLNSSTNKADDSCMKKMDQTLSLTSPPSRQGLVAGSGTGGRKEAQEHSPGTIAIWGDGNLFSEFLEAKQHR